MGVLGKKVPFSPQLTLAEIVQLCYDMHTKGLPSAPFPPQEERVVMTSVPIGTVPAAQPAKAVIRVSESISGST